MFCLGLQPFLEECKSELVLGYMDDVTLGGPTDNVSSDVALFKSKAADVGLKLNTSKCELITRTTSASYFGDSFMEGFQRFFITRGGTSTRCTY